MFNSYVTLTSLFYAAISKRYGLTNVMCEIFRFNDIDFLTSMRLKYYKLNSIDEYP